MVRGGAAAALAAEGVHEQQRKAAQQLVPLGEAVGVVIVFHAVEIEIQHDGHLAGAFELLLAGQGELKEIHHVRQAGEIVVAAGLQEGLLMERGAEPAPELRGLRLGVLVIDALVRIPEVDEAHALRRAHMPSAGVDDPVAVAAGPDAGDGFVDLRSRREAGGDLRDAGRVVRMDAEQHVVGELAVRPLPVLIAEQLAEAVGTARRSMS